MSILSQLEMSNRQHSAEVERFRITMARSGHICDLPIAAGMPEPLHPRDYGIAFGSVLARCTCGAVWEVKRRSEYSGEPARMWMQVGDYLATQIQPAKLVEFDPAAAWAWPDPDSIDWSEGRPLIPNGTRLWQLDFKSRLATEKSSCPSGASIEIAQFGSDLQHPVRFACALRVHKGRHEALQPSGYPIDWD